MSVQDAISVKLKKRDPIDQLSPQAKASDIIFNDGIDLQTKYREGLLVDKEAIDWINAISPVITVIVNTDTEFRIQIDSISGTIISPNLKGATAEELAGRIQRIVEELEAQMGTLVDTDMLNQLAEELRQEIQALTNGLLNYIPLSQKGAANGVATLDSNGLVPSSQLPSFVDDVLSYVDLEAFPARGETGKIYVDETTGKTYRWSNGSPGTYINISSAVSTADEAVKLAIPRKINGVEFDGTQDITINAEDATPRIATEEKGAANGVATLDENGQVVTTQLPIATENTPGAVIIGDNIDITENYISVKTGSKLVKGVLQVGDNISVNNNGIISISATNIENALGYSLRPITHAQIDALFI